MMARSVVEMIGEARARVEAVSPEDAAGELTAGKAVFLDVREPVEWEHHVEGAVQIPRGLLEFAADPASPKHKPELDPAGRVIVYCRSGARAALACATLKDMGFGSVANLEGGFTAWQEAGLPINEHHDGF
jgi:rhodanese-related sulfurtransferase